MARAAFAPRASSVLGLLAATAVGVAPPAVAEPTTCDPVAGAANSCAGQPPQSWPIAQGDFTSPGDPGWIFFTPFFGPAGFTGPKADALRSAQYGCGIGPDGTVGCDTVPSSASSPGQPGPPGSFSCADQYCPLPPPGTNQTVAGPQEPARYIQSDTPTFTRDVGELSEGQRLANGDAWCAVGYQGSVSCVSGANGFTLAWWGGILEKPADAPA